MVENDRIKDEFLRKFAAASPDERVCLFGTLDVTQIKDLAGSAPDLLENEADPAVTVSLIKTFASNWPRDKIKVMASRLFAENLSVRQTVLEELIKLAPDSLKAYLPKLLTASEPRIRSLAIKGLAEIDMDEAISHLDLLLMGSTTEEKIAGLQSSFFIPYEKIKPIVLKFLAAENDPDLLNQGGLVFSNNPDPEVPFRLWEIVSQSPKEKIAVMKKIVQDSCRAVEGSGLLGDRYPDYQEKLQTWIRKREATRFVQECIMRLSESEGEAEAALEAAIVKGSKQKIVREIFHEALEWPLQQPVKNRLLSLLDISGASAKGSEARNTSEPTQKSNNEPDKNNPTTEEARVAPAYIAPGLSPEKFFALPPDDRIRALAAFGPEDTQIARSILEKILRNSGTSVAETSTALRTARRLGCADFREIAQRGLKQSEAGFVTASLEYLGEFDPDQAFAILGRFLQSPNLRIKSSAIQLLKNSDSTQALSIVKTMLTSKDIGVQNSALACMVFFDFSLIRDMLVEFLEGIPDSKLISASLCLFQANPEPDNIYLLYRLQNLLPGEYGKNVSIARRQMEKSLEEMGRLKTDSTTRERDLEARWKLEKKRNEAPLPDYSVKKMKTHGQLREVAVNVASEAVGGALGTGISGISLFLGYWPIWLSVIIFLCAFFSYTFLKSLFP